MIPSFVQRPNRHPWFTLFFLLLHVVFHAGCRSAPEPVPDPLLLQRAQEQSERARQYAGREQWPAAASAWSEAVTSYALLNRRAEEASALHHHAVALRHAGQFEAAHAAAEKASALNTSLGDDDGWWRNQVLLLQIDASWNRLDEVAARMTLLKDQQARIQSPATRALFLNELGLWQLKHESVPDAMGTFQRAVEDFWRAHEDLGMATALANRARAYEANRDMAAAERDWVASLQIFMQQGDARGIATAMLGQGRTLFLQDKSPEEARELARRAADNFQRMNDRAGETEARQWLEKMGEAGAK